MNEKLNEELSKYSDRQIVAEIVDMLDENQLSILVKRLKG